MTSNSIIENKFNFRYLIENDYKILSDYWKWHRFPVPPRDFLPDNFNNGLMVTYNNENLCSGFLYATSSSSLYWLEFVVSNPEIKDKKIRKEGLRLLINKLIEMASLVNCKYIYTSLMNENLKKTYLDCGFTYGSKKVDEMVFKF